MKAQHINPLVEAVRSTFSELLECPVQIQKPYMAGQTALPEHGVVKLARPETATLAEIVVVCNISGPFQGILKVGMNRPVAAAVLGQLAVEFVDVDSEAAAIALGNLIEKTAKISDHTEITFPSVVCGPAQRLRVSSSAPTVGVPLLCERGELSMEFTPTAGSRWDDPSWQSLLTVLDLTTDVTDAVATHNGRMKQINQELHESQVTQQGLFSSLDKIYEANQALQNQLAAANDKLEEQAQKIAAFSEEARTDPLTKLSNRRAFDENLVRGCEQAHCKCQPFSLLLLDVDQFKRLNDSHGHLAGDKVLQSIARVLRQRDHTGQTSARFGGEEFAVVLSNTTLKAAQQMAEQLRRRIAQTITLWDSHSLQVTTSVGVAALQDEEPPTSLIQRADESLYASKEAGRNCTHYHDGLRSCPVKLA